MKLLPFEQYTNLLQIAVLLFLSNWVWLQARRTERETTVHIFAAGLFSFFLGDLFWTAHLLVRGYAPGVFSPADVAWVGLFIWFFSAARPLCAPNARHPWWVWALPALVAANCIIWVAVLHGGLFTNALWGVVMTLLAWQLSCGLAEKNRRLRPFFLSVLVFLLVELGLFLAGGTLYAVLDLLVTACTVVMSVTLIRGTRHAG